VSMVAAAKAVRGRLAIRHAGRPGPA
jgi:hypothetical protein